MKSENCRIVGVQQETRPRFNRSGNVHIYDDAVPAEITLKTFDPLPRGLPLAQLRCTLIIHEPEATPGEQLRAFHLERAKGVGGAVTFPGVAWGELNAASQAVWEANAAFKPEPRKSLGQIAYERWCSVRLSKDMPPWIGLVVEARAAWEAAAAAAVEEFCR